jgi:hypothetical protein
MVLDVADHALVFAFGASTIGPAGTRGEAVVRSEVEKALVELKAVMMMEQHGGFLVVNEHLFGEAAEVLEAADETLVGMLGIQRGGTPEVEATRVAEQVDDEVNLGGHTSKLSDELTPVRLKLAPRVGLEADGGAGGAQGALGSDIVAEDGARAGVAGGLELAQDDDPVPDAVGEETINEGLEGVELARVGMSLGSWSITALKSATDGLGMDPKLGGDVLLVDTPVGQCFNHDEVLFLEHWAVPP